MEDKSVLANLVIDALGGTCAVAYLCDIQPPSVSDWRKNGIPKPWMKFFEAAYPEAVLKAEGKSRG